MWMRPILFDIDLSALTAALPPAKPTITLHLVLSGTAPLPYGQRGGDLFLEGDSSVRSIRFLRKPTVFYHFERGYNVQWRLISHLALNLRDRRL